MGPQFEQLDRVTRNWLLQLATMGEGSFPVALDYLMQTRQEPVFRGERDAVWIGYDADRNPSWKLIEGGKHMGKEWIDRILIDEPETAPKMAVYGVWAQLGNWIQTAQPWQWPDDVLPTAAAALLRLEVAMKAHQDGEWDWMRDNLRWALEKGSEIPAAPLPTREISDQPYMHDPVWREVCTIFDNIPDKLRVEPEFDRLLDHMLNTTGGASEFHVITGWPPLRAWKEPDGSGRFEGWW